MRNTEGFHGMCLWERPGKTDVFMEKPQENGTQSSITWENCRKPMGNPSENHGKMEVYPLINIDKQLWKDAPFSNLGKLTVSTGLWSI